MLQICVASYNSLQDMSRNLFICKKKLADKCSKCIYCFTYSLATPCVCGQWRANFSKLKLIKDYLRSTMTQEMLVGFSTLSIEHEIAEKLDLNLSPHLPKLKHEKSNFNETLTLCANI